jgi:hypothetical protein
MSTNMIYSPEWTAEARRAAALLEAALSDPDDRAAITAAVESLEKLGVSVPVSRILSVKK